MSVVEPPSSAPDPPHAKTTPQAHAETVGKTSRDFQVFAKPGGAACNLDCQYCYYRDKSGLYGEAGAARMNESLLEEYIVQHIAAAGGPEVAFSWHGGEPTILGVDFYRKAVELQRKHKPAGWQIRNGIQTNGVLIDEEWGRYLAAEGFSIGLSLDGPAELHDTYRLSKGGQPTHRQAMRGYEMLRKHGVFTTIVCVVHNLNVKRPLSVYRFFREIGCRHLGFLPAVTQAAGSATGVDMYTPAAEDYGAFLCKIFDEWAQRDVGRIAVQTFEEAARPALGMEHSLCVFRETCGQIPVLEHNGDLFPCDHYVDGEHRLGNIGQTPLDELLDCRALRDFGSAKRDALPGYCRECEVLAMCNGGCPKYRFIRTPEGEAGLNYLCAGLKRFFLHSRERLERLAGAERAPARPPRMAPGQPGMPGRNDLCPCGSGLKYKKCCAARA